MSLRLLVLSCGLAACRSETNVGDEAPPLDTDVTTTDSDCVTPTDLPTTDPPIVTDATWWAPDGLLPDEACGPWVLDDSSKPEDPVLMLDELDLGNDVESEILGYHQSADVLDFPAVVWFEGMLHTVITDQSGIQQVQMSVQLGDVDRKAVLVIAPDVVFLRANDTQRGDALYTSTEAIKTYTMSVNTATQVVEVYRNDQLILTGSTYPTSGPVDDEIAFGDLATNSLSTTHWKWVAHNALKPTPCPPPNPCAR